MKDAGDGQGFGKGSPEPGSQRLHRWQPSLMSGGSFLWSWLHRGESGDDSSVLYLHHGHSIQVLVCLGCVLKLSQLWRHQDRSIHMMDAYEAKKLISWRKFFDLTEYAQPIVGKIILQASEKYREIRYSRVQYRQYGWCDVLGMSRIETQTVISGALPFCYPWIGVQLVFGPLKVFSLQIRESLLVSIDGCVDMDKSCNQLPFHPIALSHKLLGCNFHSMSVISFCLFHCFMLDV